MSLNKIMVVIDPTTEQQPAFERALDSARLTGAQLHLYLCVNSGYGASTHEEAKQQHRDQLENMSRRALADGVETICEVDWAEDWRRQAVSAAARCSASMVFKNSFDHSNVQREMRTTSDWTLLRLSPCPVLMIKNHHNWKHRRVLAAINSRSTDEAHIKLNHQIVSFAQSFSDAYGSDAHFVSAYQDRNHIPEARELSENCGVALDCIHIREGSAAEVISEIAAEVDADLIIIGTVGRDGIKGRVLGNTSEKVLDHTRADVLVLN
jgi:universal stress protein E